MPKKSTQKTAGQKSGGEQKQRTTRAPRGRKKEPVPSTEPAAESKPAEDVVAAEIKPTPPPTPHSTSATAEDAQEMVVFAFRLTRSERDLIHAASGPSKASRFVRELALAAAKKDQAGLDAIMESVKTA